MSTHSTVTERARLQTRLSAIDSLVAYETQESAAYKLYREAKQLRDRIREIDGDPTAPTDPIRPDQSSTESSPGDNTRPDQLLRDQQDLEYQAGLAADIQKQSEMSAQQKQEEAEQHAREEEARRELIRVKLAQKRAVLFEAERVKHRAKLAAIVAVHRTKTGLIPGTSADKSAEPTISIKIKHCAGQTVANFTPDTRATEVVLFALGACLDDPSTSELTFLPPEKCRLTSTIGHSELWLGDDARTLAELSFGRSVVLHLVCTE